MDEAREAVVTARVEGHYVSVLYDEKEKRFTFEVAFSDGRKDAVSLAAKKRPHEEQHDQQNFSDCVDEKIEFPKRKRVKAEQEDKKVEEATIDMLPAEIMQNILGEVSEDKVMRVVCRSVCRVWRELMISPPLNHSPLQPCTGFAYHAISKGWISILHWAIEHGCIWTFQAVREAAKSGFVEVLKLLGNQKHSDKWKKRRFSEITNSIDAIKWLVETGYNMDWDSQFLLAAQRGHIHILEWIHSLKVPDIDFQNAFSLAVEVGQMESLKWLKENDKDGVIEWNEGAFRATMYSGKVEALEWMRANGCPWDETVFARAVELKDLDCIKWLHENGCPWDGPETVSAFLEVVEDEQGKGLEILKWAKENGYQWDGRKMSKRALMFETIKWLKEEGVGWSRSVGVTYAAVTSGSLENVKWAIDNGCTASDEELENAVLLGNLAIAKYLREMGCHFIIHICDKPAALGNIEMLKWLREEGCDWGNTAKFAAIGGHLHILKWAIESGCPFKADDKVLECKHDHVLKWLIAKGLLQCDGSMWKVFSKNGDVEMLDWLKEKGHKPKRKKEITRLAAQYNRLNVLQWCRENGIDWTKETLSGALAAPSPAALRFIFNTHPDVKQMLIDSWCKQQD